MKTAMIGQDIPTLLPGLLTDLLYTGREKNARVAIEESNPAMQDVLRGYGQAFFEAAGLGGEILVSGSRDEVLDGADVVFYAGDCQPASRFFQDRTALESDQEGDPGLTDQARVNGGIEGLLHTLRAGSEVMKLCDSMDSRCPQAIVINLGQPMARMTEIFVRRGYRCFGMGRTPLRGANGLDSYAKRMGLKPDQVDAVIAGLPGFAFLLDMKEGRMDLLDRLKRAAKKGELGSLSKRWLGWWDAVPVGDVTDHAEFLAAQEDYIPDERPEFGESVEKRKERILYMNTIREQGAVSREGAMAMMLLLSKVPPIRPMRLALALVRGENADIPAVTRRNGKELPQLPETAMIESGLTLVRGQEESHGIRLPDALAEIMREIDETNRYAAAAAMGDREALRLCVEADPALGGLDRLYCMDVVEALIELHRDVIGI